MFSKIDEPLDFIKTLENGSVLNVVSMNKICFVLFGNQEAGGSHSVARGS